MASHIEVDYTRDVYVTIKRDPEDSWSRDSTAANITVHGIKLVKNAQYRDITVPFDVDINKSYILLWADYNTGDSFGSDRNLTEFIDLFETVEAAEAARKALETATGDAQYTREDGSVVQMYVPWHGYFESLNSINLDLVRVTKL